MKPSTLIKIKKEALDHGLAFVQEEKNGHNSYIFQSCGHTQTISQSKVRINSFACKECALLKIKNEAASNNLTFIEKSKGDFNLYQFNECKHSQLLRSKHVRNNHFCCSECKDLLVKSDASKNGLTFISLIPSSSKNIYKFNKCNHVQEINPKHVRDGSFCCHDCGESYTTKPSGVYIVKITNSKGFSWLKFGVSKHIKRRISEYKLNDSTCEIIINQKVKTNSEAVLFEKNVHKSFKHESLCPTKMKKLMKSGFTECYSLSMLDKLVESIKPLSLI